MAFITILSSFFIITSLFKNSIFFKKLRQGNTCRIRNYSSGFGWHYLALTRHLDTIEFYQRNPISISQYENRKKAANIVCEKLSGKPKDFRHNGFARSSQSHPPGLIPFPFGFPLFPHWFAAFFFPVFLLGK
ncbi:hypothetical protein [uncultured Chitinophaga sp.]|uniref:hypothetical protein n=1 Tax=uncultured Chitinophaga sp. TaxID=339340 RepID=UPI0026210613|nr:hypothetical protein [uncultured Chitinophaga sp.]